MSTCNRLDLESLGSQPTMPKILLRPHMMACCILIEHVKRVWQFTPKIDVEPAQECPKSSLSNVTCMSYIKHEF